MSAGAIVFIREGIDSEGDIVYELGRAGRVLAVTHDRSVIAEFEVIFEQSGIRWVIENNLN